MNAVRKLAKCLKSVTQKDLQCVVMGDINCNLLDSTCSRSQLLNGVFDDKIIILPKKSDYSFVQNSRSVSNIDHTACSKNINGGVTARKHAVFAGHSLMTNLSSSQNTVINPSFTTLGPFQTLTTRPALRILKEVELFYTTFAVPLSVHINILSSIPTLEHTTYNCP